MKKILFFTVLFFFVFFWGGKSEIKADEIERFYTSETVEKAIAGLAVSHNFTVDVKCSTSVVIMTKDDCALKAEILDGAGVSLCRMEWTSEDAQRIDDVGPNSYMYMMEATLDAGRDYRLQLLFEKDNEFEMMVGRKSVEVVMQMVTLTKGFSQKLETSGQEVIRWEIKDDKVIQIKNNKVIGKKSGTTTVTAYVKDTLRYVWEIRVEENQYTEDKVPLSKKANKKNYIQVCKAYYSKNKIVLKLRIVNNSKISYTQINNLKCEIKSYEGKKIGTYNLKEKSLKIPARSVKSLTCIITKPKIKNADLRKAVVKVDGTLFYYK